MAKNEEFLKVLQDAKGLQATDGTGLNCLAALDALLAVDFESKDSLKNFRDAVVAHKTFWIEYNSFNNKTLLDGCADATDPKVLDRYLNSNDFLTLQTDFLLLKQYAAEQRVLLSITRASKKIISSILNHNIDACRTLIADEKNFGALKSIPNWRNEGGVTILTDKAIKTIQEQAAELLFLKLLAESTLDLARLKTLYDAKDKKELGLAISNASGLDKTPVKHLAFPLSQEIRKQLHDKITKMQVDVAEKEEAVRVVRAEFEDFVLNLKPSTSELPLLKAALEASEPAFIDFIKKYKPSFEQLKANGADGAWAKGVLGTRYLQSLFAQPVLFATPAQCCSILNTADVIAMRSTMKQIVGVSSHGSDDGYIDNAVTDTSISLLKNTVAQQYIRHIAGAQLSSLLKLNNSTDNNIFNNTMALLGINQAGWVTYEERVGLKQAARSRAFELFVIQHSKFPEETHTALLNEFNKCTLEKQNAFLAKPETIRRLINAQDKETITYYFGSDVENVDAILVENKRIALFSEIHNTAVAKIFAGIKPDIELDEVSVKAINAALHEFSSQSIKYKQLVKEIRKVCSNFNVSVSVSVEPSIKVQSDYNKDLIVEYKSTSNPVSLKLIDLFLRLNKSESLKKAQFNAMVSTLNTLNTPEEFIKAIKEQKVTNDDTLINSLKMELSDSLFNQLKGAGVQKGFNDSDPGQVQVAVTQVRSQLVSLQNIRKPYTDSAVTLDFIAEATPIDLFNPAFQGKARAEAVAMKDKYQEVVKECTLILERLKRNNIILNSYLTSLSPTPAPAAVEDQRIKELRTDLEAEIAVLQSDIKFYTKVQTNISGNEGILQAIDDAVKNKKNYTYQPEGVTCQPFNADGTIPDMPSETTTINSLTTASTAAASSVKYKLEEGSSFVYDYVYTGPVPSKPQSGTPLYQALGRFTQHYEPSKSDHPACTIKIVKAPERKSGNDRQIYTAKVKFYMNIAATLLAANGGKAPTKENPIRINGYNQEEISFLWTALVVLGEGTPRFGIDAIKVETGPFYPEQERGLFGFTKNSLYKQVFKNPEFTTKRELVGKKEDVHGIAEKAKKTDENRTRATKAIHLFKSKLEDVKIKSALSETEEKLDAEGPIPPTRS